MDAAFWNDRYAAEEYAYGEAPNAFAAEMVTPVVHNFHPDDIRSGTGTGRADRTKFI